VGFYTLCRLVSKPLDHCIEDFNKRSAKYIVTIKTQGDYGDVKDSRFPSTRLVTQLAITLAVFHIEICSLVGWPLRHCS